MRLSCFFTVSELPIAYRMGIVSIIKECLQLSDGPYFRQTYGNRLQTKPFAFAPYLHNFLIKKDRFLLEGLQITLSSPDHQFLLHFYNGLLQKRQFSYKGCQLSLKSTQILPEPTISSPSIICKTLSPLLIENKAGQPLAPSSPDYEYHFNYLADIILKEYRGQGLLKPLKMKPLDMKKVVIKETNHEFEARFGKEKYLFFTAYQGLFELGGVPADLCLLHQLGISKRRNQGFGLFSLA